jgi:hypothetical protein
MLHVSRLCYWPGNPAVVPCLTHYALRHEAAWVVHVPIRYLALATSWKPMLSFMCLPLYPKGKVLY